VVELYARKSGQELPAAVAELQIDARLEMTQAGQSTYQMERDYNQRCLKVWREGQKRLEGGMSLPAKAILTELRCMSLAIHGNLLARNHSILGAADLEELFLDKEERKRLRADLGNYHAFAIPVWEQSRLVGLYLVNPKKIPQGYMFVKLQRYTAALAYGHALRIGQDQVVMVNDPRVALRFMVRQTVDNQNSMTVFAIPVGHEEPIHQLANQRVMFLPVSSNNQPIHHWLKRALRYDGAHTVQEWDLKFSLLTDYREKDTSKSLIRHLTNLAVPAYQAIGTYLLRAGAEGSRRAADLSLTVTEQNQVKSHFTGQDAAELTRYFGNSSTSRSIEFDGDRIDESKSGWTQDGKLVSNAVIRIDEIHNDTKSGHSIMRGIVSFDDKVVPFQEDKAKIRGAATVKWLEQLLTRHGGWFRYGPKWGARLLDIGREFSKDSIKTYSSDHPFGWEGDVLRFQRFMVDSDSVSHAVSRVAGPDIPYPENLSPAEWEAFLDPGFCMMVLALLGNLVRTHAGQQPFCIAVQSANHVVERTAEAFAMSASVDPSVERVQNEAMWPLPVMGRWSDEKLVELMRHPGPKHVMLSLDRRSFELLAVNPEWLRLPVESVCDFQALRWVFRALPILIATADLIKPDCFFTSIAEIVGPVVSLSRPQHLLLSCAAQLDSNWILSEHTIGTKTLGLLRRLADENILPIRQTQDGIRIEHADVRAAFASPVLAPADIGRLTKQLAQAGMLVGSDVGHWIVSQNMWDLVGAWSRSQA
jgi:hypothetical protein